MPGRGFLDLAREVVAGTSEFHWRGAAIHAYYAAFLEARDALFRWGFRMPSRDNVHSWVRLRLIFSAETDIHLLGRSLEDLLRLRNLASYDLTVPGKFNSARSAFGAIRDATVVIAGLDAIDTNPARRAAAIASIRP